VPVVRTWPLSVAVVAAMLAAGRLVTFARVWPKLNVPNPMTDNTIETICRSGSTRGPIDPLHYLT